MLGPSAVKPEASQGMGRSKFYLSFVIHWRPSAAGLSTVQEDVRKIVELTGLRGSLRTGAKAIIHFRARLA